MSGPLRHRDLLRYDQATGVLYVHSLQSADAWQAYPNTASVAAALAAGELPRAALPFVAGYGLALAARAWADRPSDARRGALIQASGQLSTANPLAHVARSVAEGLSLADMAIMNGTGAEAALVAWADEALRRTDRASERCGRRAAALIDDADGVLTVGVAAPALLWALWAARTEGKQPRLCARAGPEATFVAQQAQALGLPARVIAPTEDLAALAIGVVLITTEQIACDGSAVAASGAQSVAELARQQGWPCYLLGPDGPDPAAADLADLPAPNSFADVLPAALISAIITDRGIYRPAMIRRALDDGDAPLDVIPLQ